MPSLTHLADVVAAEALTFADLLDRLDAADRTAPTPCAAWTIDDLAAHVASGAFRDAESFHRARLGTSSPPAELAFSGDAASAIRLSIEHLRAALDRPPASWPMIPMAFGPYPADAALQSLVIEFGTHRNDLEVAMGDPAPFSPATLDALLGFGELYLLLQAAPLETDPMTLTLDAPSSTMSITWDGRRWARGAADGTPRCVVAGSDDALARLMLRRLDITDPRLTVDDPAHLAPVLATAIRPL
jgi:uncharacterized protein (TIGR03083 family)